MTKKKRTKDSLGYVDTVFVVNGEMIKDNGEDSYAFSVKDNRGFIGVYDGCGGIGSRRYDEFDNKTGAYISSRSIANATSEFFNAFCEKNLYMSSNNFPMICESLKDGYSSYLNSIDKSSAKSMIKGSLTKNFPTTVSNIFFSHDNSKVNSYFAWAGDSRGYILLPSGLTQVTNDDIYGNEDAFSNLSSDGNLSNFVCAGSDFKINHKSVSCPEKVVLVTATDGCFGYFSTPMEFEYMLLDTLVKANGINDWKQLLHEYILKYTGDDYTMGIAVFGFGEFRHLKKAFLRRHKQLYLKYISKLENISKNDLNDLWREYKKTYYRKHRV